MQSSSTRSRGGRHRKVNASQTAKGRIALVTVAAGTVSSAGIGGATAAQLNAAEVTEQESAVNTNTTDVDYTLANDADALLPSSAVAPQILEINEFRPVSNLAEQLDKAVAHSTERIAADLSSRLPSIVKPAEGVFTSGFGPRWGSFHNGIDIANVNGTPILAIMDGIVLDSGPASGYGNWIRIQHEDGTISLYGHMDTLDVTVGQQVHAGQRIAGMGNQGFSTGTHLHFEVHPGGGGPVDPAAWLAERGISV
ncbi:MULTISPECIES: M23 family metallopeptidase [Corynebacterium]|uniref:M23 family metallopeptidase n=1 Tax=Corynebacterium TaxID=1716 RepID=UPI0007E97AA2|nr:MULTISPECIES: M23 family metallopeptidase [Corynebacterium]MDK8478829.1 M23 family metallopeptidase [Corynebacterium pseudodiphtheriticum]MDK8487385.1 M23 family metallopeptidase [Corynebacterium pseudodiphtheriticum]MDK8494618.1 M23 family metallopeptidase [Corynebacterium pseudodiphtheriticum]MDK8500392.1 M23 family metallopeptidase [Corynebacterium pseudodiphtheriticum]MDK8545927.1 M23 family metallopeptidase [Corynebacterium pseudodiphtheriticum]